MSALRRWPTLYKKSTSNGKILTWSIWTRGAVIFTESGYKGQKQKSSRDVIPEGKNIGRSNETTPEQQAEKQAASEYKKYLDKGYSLDLKSTEAGKKAIGDTPMLAHKWEEHGDKLKFPLLSQPKLNGMRAIFENGKFLSRNRKPMNELNHLVPVAKKIQDILGGVTLDGEIYNHKFRKNLSASVSGARSVKSKSKSTENLQYHIYDYISDRPFEERSFGISWVGNSRTPEVHVVETVVIENLEQLQDYHQINLDCGYEGTMIRDPKSPYEVDKRSYFLQKFKPHEDGEFRIVGIEEGTGRLRGHVGAFILEIDDERGKRTFKSKLKGDGVTAFLKKCFTDHKLWKGKWMEVRYRGLTDKTFVPAENRSVKIRDVE